VRVPEREKLCKALAAEGIETAVHYPTPLHRMPAYQSLAGDRPLPCTDRWAREVLSLPFYPELTEEAVHEVADRLNRLIDAPSTGPAPW
jgi:dTDP-4-amino-4,6-dideoxygalactose transaminase